MIARDAPLVLKLNALEVAQRALPPRHILLRLLLSAQPVPQLAVPLARTPRRRLSSYLLLTRGSSAALLRRPAARRRGAGLGRALVVEAALARLLLLLLLGDHPAMTAVEVRLLLL